MNGDIIAWPKLKPNDGGLGIFSDKLQRNDYSETFRMPNLSKNADTEKQFAPNGYSASSLLSEACVATVLVPDCKVRDYRDRISQEFPNVYAKQILIAINADGDLSVMVDIWDRTAISLDEKRLDFDNVV